MTVHLRRRLNFLQDCIAKLEGGIPRNQWEAITAELRALLREAELVETRLETWQTLYDTLRDLLADPDADEQAPNGARFAG